VKQLPQHRRKQILEANRLKSRYAPIRFSDEPGNPNVPAWSEAANGKEACHGKLARPAKLFVVRSDNLKNNV
jgi:hypothetical protein